MCNTSMKTTVHRRFSEKSGLPCVISDGCHISRLTITKQHESHVPDPFWRYFGPNKPDPGTISWPEMSHGSITLQIMDLYSCLLMEKFRIGNLSQFSWQSAAHYHVESDRFAAVTALESGCKFNVGSMWAKRWHGCLKGSGRAEIGTEEIW
jgi:hypothetical protein